MQPQSCQQLDDYFDDQLSPEQARDFENHLESCDECREAVHIQQQFDHQLRSYAHSLRPTRPPSHVTSTTPQPTAGAGVSSKLILGLVGAIAAVLLLIALLQFHADRSPEPTLPVSQTDPPNNQTTAQNTRQNLAPVHPSRDTPEQTVIRKLSTPGHMAVIEASPDDELTFVMLYPTLNSSSEKDHETP